MLPAALLNPSLEARLRQQVDELARRQKMIGRLVEQVQQGEAREQDVRAELEQLKQVQGGA